MANVYLQGVEKNGKLMDSVLIVIRSDIHSVKVCISEPGWYDEEMLHTFIKKNYDFAAKKWKLSKKIKTVRFHPVSNSAELAQPSTAAAKKPTVKKAVKEFVVTLTQDALAHHGPTFEFSHTVEMKARSNDQLPLAGFPSTTAQLVSKAASYSTTPGLSFSRFIVGRVDRNNKVQFGMYIPIGIDVPAQLKVARARWGVRSTWIYDPPHHSEFETTFKDFQETETNLKHSGVPMMLSFMRRSVFATKSDGGTNVPEAINARIQTKPSGEVVMNTPVQWAMAKDGSIAKDWAQREDCDDTDMGIMYYGPGIAFRFSVVDQSKNFISIWDAGTPTVAFAVRNEWYVNCLKEFRPDLLPDWVPPPTNDKETLLFMGSDWCMRNDANQKRGTAGASVAGKQLIDIYSRPTKTLARWVINAFRVKYQEATHNEMPGVKIFKSTISHKDMQTVLAMVKAKKEKEAMAPLAMPVLHPQAQDAAVPAAPGKD